MTFKDRLRSVGVEFAEDCKHRPKGPNNVSVLIHPRSKVAIEIFHALRLEGDPISRFVISEYHQTIIHFVEGVPTRLIPADEFLAQRESKLGRLLYE